MTKKQLTRLHNLVYLKYRDRVKIEFIDAEADDFSAYVGSDRITLPACTKNTQSEWTLFAFLHEIGHIITYIPGSKVYEMEYMATQWAISEAALMGFQVPGWILETYQEYIYKHRESAIARHGKNILPKSRVKLKV